MFHDFPLVDLKEDVINSLKKDLFNEKLIRELGDNQLAERKFTNLLSSLSNPIMYTSLRVNTLRSCGKDIIEKIKENIDKQERERNRTCDYEIFIHPILNDCIIIKNIGPLEPTKKDKEILIDTSCGNAVLRGSNIYSKGILGSPQYMKKNDTLSVYIDVDGKGKRGQIKPLDSEKVYVGNGFSTLSRHEIFVDKIDLQGIGIYMSEPIIYAPSLHNLMPDLIFPQNIPSIVCVHVLDPQPGDVILDMCAAPGGKTSHIAVLMKNKGRVVALDKRSIKSIKNLVDLWKLNNVEIYNLDANFACSHEVLNNGPPFPQEFFDRILLDTPCSGLGQRPILKNKITLTELKSYSALQKNLLKTAIFLLKKGGILVYSTCTITLEENEKIVDWVLRKFPQLQLVEQVPYLGGPGWPSLEISLNSDQLSLLQRFDPGLIHVQNQENKNAYDYDTIGFFIAKFVKNKT